RLCSRGSPGTMEYREAKGPSACGAPLGHRQAERAVEDPRGHAVSQHQAAWAAKCVERPPANPRVAEADVLQQPCPGLRLLMLVPLDGGLERIPQPQPPEQVAPRRVGRDELRAG